MRCRLRIRRATTHFLLAAASTLVTPPAHSQTLWFKYQGNPVFDLGPPGSWDDDWIHIDRVIREGPRFRMWYTGGWDTARIGHATSVDGIEWIRDRPNPVLKPRPGTWESNVARPYVIPEHGKYHMWYTGDNRGTFRLGYATSPDGVRWTRYGGNPVLDVGSAGSWDEQFAALASVTGPDSAGGFRLWYQGQQLRIGYAAARDPVSWTRHPVPVFTGYEAAFYVRVLRNDGMYELWCGSRNPAAPFVSGDYPQPGVFVHAVSTDGIHWTESGENPVMRPGADGSWDDAGIVIGDLHRETGFYRLWYNGDDGSGKWRGGYAVSPRGAHLSVSTANAYVRPGRDAVRIALRVPDHVGLRMFARFRIPPGRTNPAFPIEVLGMSQVGQIELFDDGAHDDSAAADGLFANRWVPEEERLHVVDVELRSTSVGRDSRRTLIFELSGAAVCTSVGPVVCDPASSTPPGSLVPGDTLNLRLALRNEGRIESAQSVSVTLASTNPSLLQVVEQHSSIGNIVPGQTSPIRATFRLVASPYASQEEDVPLTLIISSWGTPLWYDRLTVRVVPPWWKTPWAYAAFGLFLAASIGGTLRFAETHKLKRRLRELEREQVLERERARISRDMHDEVGASLTEISILSEMARRSPEDAAPHLQEISQRSAEVIGSLGEIVWAMNPKNDTLESFVAYLRKYAMKFLAAAGIQCTYDTPAEIPALPFPSEKRRTLYLVVKEALHNAVKHSAASEVMLTIRFREGLLTITVSDDGAGFEPDRISGPGNGLSNMGRRMSEIGGSFVLASAPGKGTTITLTVGAPLIHRD